MTTIRILLIDDHTLFRSGLKLLLRRQSDFEVVAEAADGVEGLKRARELLPDIILLDLNMPGISGLEVLHILTQDLPELSSSPSRRRVKNSPLHCAAAPVAILSKTLTPTRWCKPFAAPPPESQSLTLP